MATYEGICTQHISCGSQNDGFRSCVVSAPIGGHRGVADERTILFLDQRQFARGFSTDRPSLSSGKRMMTDGRHCLQTDIVVRLHEANSALNTKDDPAHPPTTPTAAPYCGEEQALFSPRRLFELCTICAKSMDEKLIEKRDNEVLITKEKADIYEASSAHAASAEEEKSSKTSSSNYQEPVVKLSHPPNRLRETFACTRCCDVARPRPVNTNLTLAAQYHTQPCSTSVQKGGLCSLEEMKLAAEHVHIVGSTAISARMLLAMGKRAVGKALIVRIVDGEIDGLAVRMDDGPKGYTATLLLSRRFKEAFESSEGGFDIQLFCELRSGHLTVSKMKNHFSYENKIFRKLTDDIRITSKDLRHENLLVSLFVTLKPKVVYVEDESIFH